MPTRLYSIKTKDKNEKQLCQHCSHPIAQGAPVYLIYINQKTQFAFDTRAHLKKFFEKYKKAFVKEQIVKGKIRMNYIYLEKEKENA